MSKYGIGQQAMDQGITAMAERINENCSRQCFGGMILALIEKFDFPADRLHDLAVETMKNINGALCASELVDAVKEKSGFDVDQPLDEFEVNVRS